MALSRRNGRREINIWPGFVDAMTALLLVLMFVLTIFMVIQSVLRETITTQDSQLDSLTGQLADLADALGLERQKSAELTAAVDAARVERERQVATIAEKLAQRLKDATGRTARIEGKDTGDWVLIDTDDVVVHVFRPEVREFYQLEKMWMPTDQLKALRMDSTPH